MARSRENFNLPLPLSLYNFHLKFNGAGCGPAQDLLNSRLGGYRHSVCCDKYGQCPTYYRYNVSVIVTNLFRLIIRICYIINKSSYVLFIESWSLFSFLCLSMFLDSHLFQFVLLQPLSTPTEQAVVRSGVFILYVQIRLGC